MFEELTNEEMEKIDGDGLIKGLLGIVGALGCGIAGTPLAIFHIDNAALACAHATDACLERALSEGWYIW